MTAKPTYEELEQLANALTQEVVICSNIHGHLTGDKVLAKTGEVNRKALRESDLTSPDF